MRATLWLLFVAELKSGMDIARKNASRTPISLIQQSVALRGLHGYQVGVLYHANSARGADVTVVSAFMLCNRYDPGSTHRPVCSGFIQPHQTDAETAPQTTLRILTNTLTASLNTQFGYKF
jgi:hypothetical protein